MHKTSHYAGKSIRTIITGRFTKKRFTALANTLRGKRQLVNDGLYA